MHFTHEALMTEALQRLGPTEVCRYRDCIHTWADNYRGLRWPEDTPTYLVRSYPLLLREQRDATRLGA